MDGRALGTPGNIEIYSGQTILTPGTLKQTMVRPLFSPGPHLTPCPGPGVSRPRSLLRCSALAADDRLAPAGPAPQHSNSKQMFS